MGMRDMPRPWRVCTKDGHVFIVAADGYARLKEIEDDNYINSLILSSGLTEEQKDVVISEPLPLKEGIDPLVFEGKWKEFEDRHTQRGSRWNSLSAAQKEHILQNICDVANHVTE